MSRGLQGSFLKTTPNENVLAKKTFIVIKFLLINDTLKFSFLKYVRGELIATIFKLKSLSFIIVHFFKVFAIPV